MSLKPDFEPRIQPLAGAPVRPRSYRQSCPPDLAADVPREGTPVTTSVLAAVFVGVVIYPIYMQARGQAVQWARLALLPAGLIVLGLSRLAQAGPLAARAAKAGLPIAA